MMIVVSTLAYCFWAASGEKEINQPIEPTARSEHEQLLDPEERRKNRFSPPTPNLLHRGSTLEFDKTYPRLAPS